MDIHKLRAATPPPPPTTPDNSTRTHARARTGREIPTPDAAAWCFTQHTAHHGPPPLPGGGHNGWLAGFAKFCNESGATLDDVLALALDTAPAGHNAAKIRATVEGIYRRDVAHHGSKPYTPPRAAGHTSATRPGRCRGASTEEPAGGEAPAEPATRIRTATQRLEDARNAPPLSPLFGCLWETPGIAILAGDTGVGKSVLAVHIAHLITSDTPALLGLRCGRQEKLLYYDFELTDRQFEKRFEGLPFTDLLLTGDTNPAALDVENFTFEHISTDLERTGARIIVLDNITALAMKTTADADVSISIMKGLKRLQTERGVSSLVLAHTPKLPAGVPLSLNHLAGSKHLSNFADSVFFIGRSVQSTRTRYVKQVKNRTDELLAGVLVCELNDTAGYLGLTLLDTEQEEAQHLATPTEDTPTTARKAPLSEVQQALTTALVQPQPAGQLEAQLAEQFATDARTIRKRLKDLTDGAGYLLNQSGQVCTLKKEQHGREMWYSLLPGPPVA